MNTVIISLCCLGDIFLFLHLGVAELAQAGLLARDAETNQDDQNRASWDRNWKFTSRDYNK